MGNVFKNIDDIPILRGQIRLATVPFKIDKENNVFSCIENHCFSKKIDDCKENQCLFNKRNIERILTKDDMSCDECKNTNNNFCKGVVQKEIVKNVVYNQKLDKAKIVNLINKVKVRPYIILATNKGVGKIKRYVYGVPCYSLKDKVLNDQKFMRLLKGNEALPYYYIDEETPGISKPSWIDLSYITPIHINNLVEYKGYIKPKQLLEISEIIESFLDLRAFDNCDDLNMLDKRKKDLEKELEHIKNKISSIK